MIVDLKDLNLKEHGLEGVVMLTNVYDMHAVHVIRTEEDLEHYKKIFFEAFGEAKVDIDHNRLYMDVFKIENDKFKEAKMNYIEGVRQHLNK